MKMILMICGLFLLLASSLVIFQPATILAQDESPAEEKIELTTTYPKLEKISGESFEFEVELSYQGSEVRYFDFHVTAPEGWTSYVMSSYPAERIPGMRLDPETTYAEKVKVNISPPYWLMPEPREYQITLEVSSGEIKGAIDLTAVVTARYTMSLVPTQERYNTSATAGKDNYFSVAVVNEGSASIDNITFSTSKPKGWTIEFSPDKVDSLDAGDFQTIDVNIKPPAKTIAGDYEITLRANGKQTADNIDIRVTVETPTIWGWVGVGIVVLVIAGLAFIFMRFSRR